MNKVAIAFLSKDKIELSKQSVAPLLEGTRSQKHHTFWIDGSDERVSDDFQWKTGYPTALLFSNVKGGAGAAIVFALTTMLNHPEGYSHVGLCEQDVVLDPDWFDPAFGLFDRGHSEGLEVGAVSARSYADRVLFQRDGYAVMLNLGAGMVLFTRRAAELVLKNFRTFWTTDVRRIYAELTDIDIGPFWAFRAGQHFLMADWGWDATLAAHGLASLALTPAKAQMIGQNPPLAEQGLHLVAEGDYGERIDNVGFERYRERLQAVRDGKLFGGVDTQYHFENGTQTIFAHQIQTIGGSYSGDWRLKEVRGFGTFGWVAGSTMFESEPHSKIELEYPIAIIPVSGACAILVSGGKTGGKVEVLDEGSGFKYAPDMPPEGDTLLMLQIQIPASIAYRKIRVTAMTPGICFYGVQTKDRQPVALGATFDYSNLPPV